MYQFIKFMIAAVILSVGLFQPAQAEESGVRIFNNNEIVRYAVENSKIFHITDERFSGYSFKLFGSRDKAYAEALDKVKNSNTPFVYLSSDSVQKFLDKAPPGSIGGGDYYVVTFSPLTFINLTPESLITEIKTYGASGYLIDYAKKSEFKNLTKNYREIIRAKNDESSAGLYDLTQLIVLHEGKSCADDLIKWSKFHKNPGVRLASYLGLIQFGKTSEVEEILKSEADNSVKDKVQKNLI